MGRQVDDLVRQLTDERLKSARLELVLKQAKALIRKLQGEKFGASSERLSVVFDVEGQEVIDPEWALLTLHQAAPETPGDDKKTRRRKRAKPPPLADRCPDLEVVEVDGPVPEAFASQVAEGSLVVERTGEFTEEVMIVPQRFYIKRTYKLRLRQPDTVTAGLVGGGEGVDTPPASPSGDNPSQAKDPQAVELPLPPRIVNGGVLGCIAIHLLVIAKFLDAIPFFRTLTTWSRCGAHIARQTVNDAFIAWSKLFEPVADAIIDSIYHDPVVHADEGWGRRHERKRCKGVNLCVLVGEQQVGYRYSEEKRHRRAREFIPASFTGYLVCDGWPGWRTQTDCQRSGCNAHARRPFAAILKINPGDKDAQCIVALYASVSDIEARARVDDAGKPITDRATLRQRRKRLRHEQTRPIMNRIRVEAERIAAAHPRSSDLAKGARYILNQWKQLTRFLDNPDLPPDNNAAEGALRINALIRKNSLFFGSEDGGHRSAIALTILHSCKAAGIDPLTYLEMVTPTLIDHRERGTLATADLSDLTPRAIARADTADNSN